MPAQIERGWVDKVLSSGAFQDYEGMSLESLKKQKIEVYFAIGYDKEGSIVPFLFREGDQNSVVGIIPLRGYKFLDVHFHTTKELDPSRADIYADDHTAMEMRKRNFDSPAVHLTGAEKTDGVIYIAQQRKKFPNIFECWLLNLKYANKKNWRPFSWKRYNDERRKNLQNALDDYVEKGGSKRTKRKRVRNFYDVNYLFEAVKPVGANNYTLAIAKSLEKAFDHNIGVFESGPKGYKWLYGSAEIFD